MGHGVKDKVLGDDVVPSQRSESCQMGYDDGTCCAVVCVFARDASGESSLGGSWFAFASLELAGGDSGELGFGGLDSGRVLL